MNVSAAAGQRPGQLETRTNRPTMIRFMTASSLMIDCPPKSESFAYSKTSPVLCPRQILAKPPYVELTPDEIRHCRQFKLRLLQLRSGHFLAGLHFSPLHSMVIRAALITLP